MDNQCEFGKWLYEQASVEFQQSAQYQQVKQLHTTFHQEVARILEVALQGRQSDAMKMVGMDSNFAKTSDALVAELLEGRFGKAQDEIQSQLNGQEKTGAVLTKRAKALTTSTDTETGEMTQVVVFNLADEKYGIATAYVHEVQPLRDLTPVPCTPNFVVGIINIRGALYSVIDIRSFFGVAKKEMSETTKVILVTSEGLEIGILADDVKGATSIPTSDIKPQLAMQSVAKDEYIQGVTKDMLIILNLEALLRDERIIVREEA
jgi:purine-binding chemotaxis protein CheW